MDSLLSIEELVRELDQPNLIDWKFFSQSPDLIVYRRVNQKIISYKCFIHFPDITPEIAYKVATDIEYRLVWDRYVKEGKRIEYGDKHGVYWQVQMPLLINNRDYTFVQDHGECQIDNRQFYYSFIRSEPFENEPPRKNIVRIEYLQSQAIFSSDGTNGVKSLLLYSENPRGHIPKAIWIWAAKFGIPVYAKLTHHACETYPKWIKDRATILSDLFQHDIDITVGAAMDAMILENSEMNDDDDEEIAVD